MSDRFKFRVWDKQEGCYAYSNNSDVDLLYIETDGHLTYGVYSNDYEDMNYIPESEVIVEQCTGLKDKNGKLIYEGDIVKKEFKNKPFSSKAKTKEKLIKFKWNDNEACFSFDFLNEKDKHDNFQCWESSWKDKYSDDEIIGNIHENADLLGEK